MTDEAKMPKPCPFCGGDCVHRYPNADHYSLVICGNCGGSTKAHPNSELAWLAWNSRADTTADKATDAGEPKRHRWDRDGERCLDCGDKDWMDDPVCTPPKQPHPPAVAGGTIHSVGVDATINKAIAGDRANMAVEVAIVRHALNDKYGEGYACHNALNRIEAALTQDNADLMAVRDALREGQNQLGWLLRYKKTALDNLANEECIPVSIEPAYVLKSIEIFEQINQQIAILDRKLNGGAE